MSKRRLAKPAPEEEEEEGREETPSQRRARRERERRVRRQRTQAKGLLAGWPLWKTGAVIGGSAVAVAAVVAVLLIFVLKPPCLALETPPASSGVPDESAPSWCVNTSAAIVESMAVHLSIQVAGSPVTIPGGVGEINQAKWGWTCDMPVFTDNSTGGGTTSGGVILIASPWNFTYTLADFFNLWKESYSTATVDGTAQPISYTGTQLFNYSTTTNQVVRLWVDGQQSTAGPNLALNYLADDYGTSSEVPQCFVSQYGSGHTILLTWGWKGAGSVAGSTPHPGAPAGSTESGLPVSSLPSSDQSFLSGSPVALVGTSLGEILTPAFGGWSLRPLL